MASPTPGCEDPVRRFATDPAFAERGVGVGFGDELDT